MQKIVVEAIPLDPVEEIMYPPLASPRVDVVESSSHHHCSRNLVISSWLGDANRRRNNVSVVYVVWYGPRSRITFPQNKPHNHPPRLLGSLIMKEPRIIDGRMNESETDEEIDEDEAFNSDDELMYGGMFASSSSKLTTKKKTSSLKNGDDDDDDDSDAKYGEVDNDDNSDGRDDDDDEEDESDENDWAGSSDDGEGEDDDGGQYMLDLLNNLDSQTPTQPSTKKGCEGGGRIALTTPSAMAAVRLPESEYRSGASNGNNNLLTLDSLMGSIADTADFTSVQKSMRALSSGKDVHGAQKVQTTSVPVSRVLSNRASRLVHYESTTKDVTNWQDAIHEGRDAETLDFRTNPGGASTHRVTRDTLVDKFIPCNDFEKELHVALEKAGMDDEVRMAQKEKMQLTGFGEGGEAEDDLGINSISITEYKKRHGELAKLRALMFYEEQKNHRINKIKSKKYRKIRKRQRDRLKEGEAESADNDDDDRERIEREEMNRMRERMTLAHKNTSKWARHMLRRGSKMDVEERRALSFQIAKGEELRRKAMGAGGGDGRGGDDEYDEDETEEDLLKRARDILMETCNDDIEHDDDGDGKKTKKVKGLFQLEFMKRGMESQRARAKEEARKLLEELEANELAGMSTDDSNTDHYDVTERKSSLAATKKKTKVATESETIKILPEGKIVASSLVFGKGDNFAVKANESTELDGGGNHNNDGKLEKEIRKAKKSRRKKDGAAADNLSTSTNDKMEPVSVTVEEEENPWIVSKSTKKSIKTLHRKININDAASMLVESVRDNKSDKRKRNDDDVVDDDDQQHNKGMEDSTTKIAIPLALENTNVGIADLSQAELVRRAFATPANLCAEEEFDKEKQRMRERDDPTRQKKEETTVVSGWGSWTGAGASPPRKQQRKLPPKLSAPLSKALLAAQQPKRKDDGISTVIINEKRLKKTAKFQLAEIPYPYRSREEYERAISGSIGQEWNTIHGTKEMSRPAILVRAGKIIQPLATKAKKKVARAPAKF